MMTDGSRWRDVNIAPFHCNFGPEDCFASNYGDWLDLVAPGGRLIVTTQLGGGYYTLDGCDRNNLSNLGFGGTSAAAPVVAGAAALLRSYRPRLTGEDIEQLLKMGARNLFNPPYDPENGYGFIRVGESSPNLVGNLCGSSCD